MARLVDKIQEKEMKEEPKERVGAVSKIKFKDGSKDKQISAKVNERTYAMFSAINKIYGLSNNSTLNMLISEYVRDKKDILKDEDLG